ncbi:glycosyltransferase family 1 protein [Planococcus maritimus]|uniref:glycosyltransferase family 1 protein n=1 Tax=Planococcus maritimus TaxID=192421 RepID=UPI0031387164
MDPIRILQVVPVMNTGGIETQVMNFYRNIDKSKVQFDFLIHGKQKGFYDSEILSLGGKIFNVPSFNPFKQWSYNKALEAFFAEHNNYKVVHSHINTFSTYPLRAAKLEGIPIRIAHSHIAYPRFDYKTPFKKYAKANLLNYATHYFACSNLAGEWLYGKKDNEFVVLKNSVDLEKFSFNPKIRDDIRTKYSLSNNLVIGHVGRLNKQKNHQFILEIFKEVNINNPNTKLVLVGDGELRGSIEKQIKLLGLKDSVILMGVRSDIPDLLQAMDLFLFPSLYEGLPVTLIEAQTVGLPCIVSTNITKEVAVTDLIEYCSLKEPVKTWAQKIDEKLKNYNRGSSQEKITNAGYDIKKTTKWLENFYIKKAEAK